MFNLALRRVLSRLRRPTPRGRRYDSAAFALALAIFFVSGFAALAYQVIWQRLLVIFSGADILGAANERR